jgi:hypothetical protein
MAGSDPLPSWNEGSAKQSILNFVREVTTAGDPNFVKPEERIAVFDNDGTLCQSLLSLTHPAFTIATVKSHVSGY